MYRPVTSQSAVLDAAERVQIQQIMLRVNFSRCSLHVNGKLPGAASMPQLLHPPTPLLPSSISPIRSASDSPHQLSTAEWSRADSTSASPPSPLAGHPHTQTLCKEPPVCLKFSMCMRKCARLREFVCMFLALPEYKCASSLRAESNV